MFQRVKWSPIEIEYLEKHQKESINQLCIKLAKTRGAIQKKLKELDPNHKQLSSKPSTKRSNIGRRKDLGIFLRSSWEANVYRLLLHEKKAYGDITKIEYEPEDFLFTKFGIVKGTVSYTPDFRITYKDGSYQWLEVKGGFLRRQDQTKLRRFKKYYPDEFKKLIAVTPGPESKTALFFKEMGSDIKWHYPEINKKYRKLLPGWE